jgi:hypothetical protein
LFVQRVSRKVIVVVLLLALLAGMFGALLPASGATEYSGFAVRPGNDGYWLVTDDGEVAAFGAARLYGDMRDKPLNESIVGMSSTASGLGYWLVAADGGVFSFGDAVYFGSTGSMRLNEPVVGIAATTSGKGYWMVARDGGIFAFGDAAFLGSTGAMSLNAPITGMTATPDGRGYWLVADDGGIFAFGSAAFRGSTGSLALQAAVVGMASTPTGHGYWLIAADGGVFAYGDATFKGSISGSGAAVLAIAVTNDGGYLLIETSGRVTAFGTQAPGASPSTTALPPATSAPVPTTAKPTPTTSKPTTTSTTAPVVRPAGKPNASNTGVPTGTELVVRHGDIYVTEGGTVLDGLDIRGHVIVKAANVVIKNSIVRGPDGGPSRALITANGSNTLIQDVELVPTISNRFPDGIHGYSYTAVRAKIHGTVDGAKAWGEGNVTIKDSWIYDLKVFPDPSQPDNITHNDGVQIEGGTNVNIVNTVIDGPRNAGLMLTQNTGRLSNVTVSQSWISSPSCGMNVSEKGKGPITNIVVKDSQFSESERFPAGCAIIAPSTSRPSVSNSFFMGSGDPIFIKAGG